MTSSRVDRKLVAILAADVHGYSRMMGIDEEGTLDRLTAHRRDLFDPSILKYRGKIVKTTGDGLLAQFGSVVDAVRCAIEVQTGMALRNADRGPDERIDFRIGIHDGDIVEQDGDIFGDGVNIAARLEGIAEPGGICASQRVQEDAAGKIDLPFEDIGDQMLKNIARPIRVFRLHPDRTKTLRQAAPPKPSTLSLPDKPSIAVLPFHNMSGDPGQDYFGDGITEDLTTALSKLRTFFVISRNSSFTYKDTSPDVRQVARDLGVRYVLAGSVRKSGERLRVTSQLVDATVGTQLWAERYDRAVADIFALQDEITGNVVASIEPQLYAAENIRFQSQPPENLDAWGHVVRAMPFVWTWAEKDNETAVAGLKRAIELAPTYARAYSLLAWTYAVGVQMGWTGQGNPLDVALATARRAIELDWEDAWAHLAVGYVHMLSRRSRQAIEELEEVLRLNPSFAWGHTTLGAALGFAGEAQQGLDHIATAMRLSPRDPHLAIFLSAAALCHFVAGRYEESASLNQRAVQLRPHFTSAWRSLAAASGIAGDKDTAQAALAEAKRLQPQVSAEWVARFQPFLRQEDRDQYMEGLRTAGLLLV